MVPPTTPPTTPPSTPPSTGVSGSGALGSTGFVSGIGWTSTGRRISVLGFFSTVRGVVLRAAGGGGA